MKWTLSQHSFPPMFIVVLLYKYLSFLSRRNFIASKELSVVVPNLRNTWWHLYLPFCLQTGGESRWYHQAILGFNVQAHTGTIPYFCSRVEFSWLIFQQYQGKAILTQSLLKNCFVAQVDWLVSVLLRVKLTLSYNSDNNNPQTSVKVNKDFLKKKKIHKC